MFAVLITLLVSSLQSLASPFSPSWADYPSRLSPSSSIYDVLKAHGLPMGLLPEGVKEFRFHESGQFEVQLDQACNAKFESQLHYDRNVSGMIKYGQIGALSGMSAQELFLWFPVKEIRVDVPSSGIIYFDVGVVFKQFSLSLFETPPVCTAIKSESSGGAFRSSS
ncbi:hypothetical protein SAY87_010226 [Trapa incisa]|uniref:Uncharacterized protein n=2 Tax=Trapa TaxID=22665 RepID=A0AAN7M001_TRANT|nr:hypothetical protein SAY87_010226 [Trapa incisa]KAK4794564.1 hypothetical protein SAY86_012558 [Trapa natans]